MRRRRTLVKSILIVRSIGFRSWRDNSPKTEDFGIIYSPSKDIVPFFCGTYTKRLFFVHTTNVNGVQHYVETLYGQKRCSKWFLLCFTGERKSFTQIWSKWWQNLWLNYLFKVMSNFTFFTLTTLTEVHTLVTLVLKTTFGHELWGKSLKKKIKENSCGMSGHKRAHQFSCDCA